MTCLLNRKKCAALLSYLGIWCQNSPALICNIFERNWAATELLGYGPPWWGFNAGGKGRWVAGRKTLKLPSNPIPSDFGRSWRWCSLIRIRRPFWSAYAPTQCRGSWLQFPTVEIRRASKLCSQAMKCSLEESVKGSEGETDILRHGKKEPAEKRQR